MRTPVRERTVVLDPDNAETPMDAQHARTGRSPGATLAEAVEDDSRLDGVVEYISPRADVFTGGPTRRHVLLGRWLGHALHPLLTDLPIGFWTSSWVLDVVPVAGGRRASQRLIGLGLLSAVPTAVTGWAEWSQTSGQENRRVGVAHAAANSAALGLYTASWLARRRGRHGTGVLLGQLAVGAASAGGFLGAHLAIGRKVGTGTEDAKTGG